MNKTSVETSNKTALAMPSTAWHFSRYLSWVFWGILAVFLGVYCAQPIGDPDFWWHLKSGEVMLNQGGLLHNDPFNYTSNSVISIRESVILKGYWLWQVVAALFYHAGGVYGIFALKAVTLLLLIGGVLREMHRQAVSLPTKQALIGLGAVIIIGGYQGFLLERPQMFSFILMTVQLGMFAKIRLEQRPSWMLLPLMSLWSNIHGGFVVGDILLALFAVGAVIQYRHEPARLILLLCWAGAGIVASLANPAGWNAIVEVVNFAQQNMMNKIDEYKSSWVQFKDAKLIGLLWLVALLHLFGLLFARKIFWPEIIISLFLIAFGVVYLRNVPFVVLSMMPMVGWYLDRAGERFGFTQMRRAQSGVLIVLSTLLVWQTAMGWHIKKNGWPIRNIVPVNMAAFIQTSGLSGHLFNDYGAGGYLNWALFPLWQTFIDGRGLDNRVFHDYGEIIEGTDNDAILFNKYNIDVIALNIMLPSGRVTPLLELFNNPDWAPVYLDSNYFVLAKNTEKNSAALSRIMINKQLFMNSLLNMFDRRVGNYPGDVGLIAGYTSLLIYAERYAEAEFMLNKLEQEQAGANIVAFLRHELTQRRLNYYRAIGG